MRIQNGDGSTLYDALELSFNTTDKTSILKNNNIDILQPINNVVSSNVYSQTDIDVGFKLKSEKSNTYLKI